MDIASKLFVALAKPTAGSNYTLSTFPRLASLQATTRISRVRLHCWLTSQGHTQGAKDVTASRSMTFHLTETDLHQLGFRER